MDKTIYKYPLDPQRALVDLPKGARILKLAPQGGREDHFLWALVDPNEKEFVSHFVFCAGTGNALRNGIHLAVIETAVFRETTLTRNGSLVLHWFIGCPSIECS